MNKQELILLKPETSPLSNKNWIALMGPLSLMPGTNPLAHAYVHDFKQWVKDNDFPELRLKNPIHQLFGPAGKTAWKKAKGDFKKFSLLLSQITFKPEKFGIFGNWWEKAKINKKFAKDVIVEYLND